MPTSAHLITFAGHHPQIDPDAWVAANATLIGQVRIGARSTVFYSSVLRADTSSITIGDGTNLQDGVVVHADEDFPTTVGSNVTVGHRAVLHGCTLEDGCLIGMSATVLNGAVIGSGSLVAAGAVVLEGTVIPPNSLVAGIPGKVRREVNEIEVERIRAGNAHYIELGALHAAAGG